MQSEIIVEMSMQFQQEGDLELLQKRHKTLNH